MGLLTKFFTLPERAILPAVSIFLITPNNSVDLSTPTRGLSIAAEGDLRVLTINDETVTVPEGALAAGIIHPICVKRVYSTGTTATGIVGYA